MIDNKLIENLIKALQYEYKTYLDILGVAEKKTDSLVKNDIAALSAITEEENKMAEQTVKLNQVREQLIMKLCEETKQDYKAMTIEIMKELVSVPYKKHLSDIHEKLKDVISKLSVRNGINQKLIENAIKYINFNIQLIASPQPAVPLYGRSGQEVAQNNKRSMLDVKF